MSELIMQLRKNSVVCKDCRFYPCQEFYLFIQLKDRRVGLSQVLRSSASLIIDVCLVDLKCAKVPSDRLGSAALLVSVKIGFAFRDHSGCNSWHMQYLNENTITIVSLEGEVTHGFIGYSTDEETGKIIALYLNGEHYWDRKKKK